MNFFKKLLSKKLFYSFVFVLFDILMSVGVFYASVLTRFDFKYSNIDENLAEILPYAGLTVAMVTLAVYWLCQLYNMIWHYFGLSEMGKVAVAVVVSNVVSLALTWALFERFPWSVYLMTFMMQTIFTFVSRGAIRIIGFFRSSMRMKIQRVNCVNAMIIGAGNAGKTIIDEYRANAAIAINPVCIIDDDPEKKGCFVDGVPVVGDRTAILHAA